jgi:hypothetical protein
MSGKAQNEHIASGFPARADMERTSLDGSEVPVSDMPAYSLAVAGLRIEPDVCPHMPFEPNQSVG